MLDEPVSEISKAESSTCAELRPILEALPVGSRIPDTDLCGVLSGLERFLPEVLAELHAGESLDGIIPADSYKTADREIEIIGLCIFLGDQALTPLRLQLQLDENKDTVSWLEYWLGESTAKGMLRIPHHEESKWFKKLHTLSDRLDAINWTYHVGYGNRHS
ncbi:MAG: hypothetical protein IH991_20405 [Planctomycetes bacterium]|nr:hypothetical protein [Planctomycetota bacterium]